MPALQGLRELRESEGESQEALAKTIGVTRGQISQYEGGVSAPSMDMAIKLADHYGVSIDRLFYAVAGSRR